MYILSWKYIVCTGSTLSLEYNLDMEKGTLCFGMPSKGGCAFSVLWCCYTNKPFQIHHSHFGMVGMPAVLLQWWYAVHSMATTPSLLTHGTTMTLHSYVKALECSTRKQLAHIGVPWLAPQMLVVWRRQRFLKSQVWNMACSYIEEIRHSYCRK